MRAAHHTHRFNGVAADKSAADRALKASAAHDAKRPSDLWAPGAKPNVPSPCSPRFRIDENPDAGATTGFYSKAVSAAMLGVTGVGALVSTAAVAEPMHNMSVENIDMPEVTIEDLDPVAAKTNRVMEDLSKKIESESLLTARDLANGNYEFLDGHPGYRKLSEAEMMKIISSSFKDLPMGALPGGTSLANLVENLPGFQDKDVSLMSYREIRAELRDDAKDWFKDKFGDTIKEHKIESAILGIGGVASLRSASPEAREFINKHAPSIKIWSENFHEGHIRAGAALKYRGDDLLPNVDLSVSGHTNVGPVKLRGTATSSLSVDNTEIVNSRLSVGARIGDKNAYGDASAWVSDNGRYGTSFELGKHAEIKGVDIHGRSRLDFGPGTAHDPNADGRLSFELEASKTLRDRENNVRGSFGLYGKHSVDLNGGEDDTRVGVTFRWTF